MSLIKKKKRKNLERLLVSRKCRDTERLMIIDKHESKPIKKQIVIFFSKKHFNVFFLFYIIQKYLRVAAKFKICNTTTDKTFVSNHRKASLHG